MLKNYVATLDATEELGRYIGHGLHEWSSLGFPELPFRKLAGFTRRLATELQHRILRICDFQSKVNPALRSVGAAECRLKMGQARYRNILWFPESFMTDSNRVQPLYASIFRCIGGACEDTCCHGMGVMVDKATYNRYQSLPPGDIRSLVQRKVSLNLVGATDTLYAKIDCTPADDCPFLASDRLCGIQKEFGPEYLSATCSIYPRVLNSVNDELETSLYLSCPEAARLVLLNPDSTEAEGNVASSHFRTDQFSRLVTSDQNSIHKPYAYFDEIRVFVVNLIQNRTRPMWQRLFLLGMMCRDLDAINTAEKDSDVPRILRDYKEILAKGALYREMENVPARPEKQLDLVLRLTGQCILGGASGPRFETCFQEFLQGIGYSRESTVANTTAGYVEAEERFLQPFLEQHPFMMENYLLNYVFRTLFPFGRESSAHHTPQSILAEYTMMATQYALIKGLLIGMAGHYQAAFNSEHVVRLVQSFSKAVEHNLTYLNEIKNTIRSQDLSTPEGILILLKCSTAERCRLITERRPTPSTLLVSGNCVGWA